MNLAVVARVDCDPVAPPTLMAAAAALWDDLHAKHSVIANSRVQFCRARLLATVTRPLAPVLLANAEIAATNVTTPSTSARPRGLCTSPPPHVRQPEMGQRQFSARAPAPTASPDPGLRVELGLVVQLES